jgi:hypothetical protein
MSRIAKQKRMIIDQCNKRILGESTNDGINILTQNGKIKMGDGSLWVLYAESSFGWFEVEVLDINENEVTVKHPVTGTIINRPMNSNILNYILKMYEQGKKTIYFTDRENKKYKVVKFR